MSPSPLPFAPKLVSKCTIHPDLKSFLPDLKLSVSDLPMLSCQYIQKGVLLGRPPLPSDELLPLLRRCLSHTLSLFPPLAGRLSTNPTSGHVYITCNDAGADFVHAIASSISLVDVLSPLYVPDSVRDFFCFAFDGAVSYNGHFHPLLSVQVTELADGIFIGCAVNHAVIDGTSLWNFFNTFAEVCRSGARRVCRQPNFTRNFFHNSTAVLKFPDGGPKVTFSGADPLRERVFRFSRAAILELKERANGGAWTRTDAEILGKESNDVWTKAAAKGEIQTGNRRITAAVDRTVEISSFQSLSAQLWRSVTRARKLPSAKNTTFRMAVNCRHRVDPPIDLLYFGNAIQSIPTVASVGEILSRDLRWCAGLLNRNVVAHGNDTVRRGVEEWERQPRVFPLGNFDGASITMGSSPRFPMYDNDFGWGRPMAVRSGRANKFDGKISAFPGREGGGSVDLEVCLSPATMTALEADTEFMKYVTE